MDNFCSDSPPPKKKKLIECGDFVLMLFCRYHPLIVFFWAFEGQLQFRINQIQYFKYQQFIYIYVMLLYRFQLLLQPIQSLLQNIHFNSVGL